MSLKGHQYYSAFTISEIVLASYPGGKGPCSYIAGIVYFPFIVRRIVHHAKPTNDHNRNATGHSANACVMYTRPFLLLLKGLGTRLRWSLRSTLNIDFRCFTRMNSTAKHCFQISDRSCMLQAYTAYMHECVLHIIIIYRAGLRLYLYTGLCKPWEHVKFDQPYLPETVTCSLYM
jgi:hypothetical protein